MATQSWQAVAKTDVGTKRKINEDSYLQRSEHHLWCVADGMGGHARGDFASSLIIDELNHLLDTALHTLQPEDISQCIENVNQMLWGLSQKNNTVVGSTVALLVFKDDKAHCIWAGDSRVYRLRGRTIQRLTKDHSQVEDLIDAGLITEAEAEKHPKANIITKAVGASKQLQLESKSYELMSDDVFLLCSDGLNKVVSDAELENYLNGVANSHAADLSSGNIADFLIQTSLTREAKDNVTCIAVFPDLVTSQKEPCLDATLPLVSE